MEKITLNVEGMSCAHCEKSVKDAVGELAGVASVNVSLAEKTVVVEYDPKKVSPDKFKIAIEEEDFKVV
ncbi:MAG: copper ion binding protein [Acetobacterium sp.]